MSPTSAVLRVLATVARASGPEAASPATWDAYQEVNSLTCVGTLDRLPGTEIRDHAGFRYEFSGSVARVRRFSPSRHAGEARLGVLAGIKDLDTATRSSLDEFIARFRTEEVDAILVGGDSAYNEEALGGVFAYLAATQLPVVVVVGNAESRSAFNRAAREVSREAPNLINADLARRIDGDGFDVITLPGYHDRRFVHASAACLYRPQDVETLRRLARECDDPVILLAHGPPRQRGAGALDFVPGPGNVGDPAITRALATARIPFGIFGHVLEAGGRVTDLSGKVAVKPGSWAKAAYVNPGAANALPWRLNGGGTTWGSAAVLRLKGGRMRVDILRAPKREITE